ncbi:S-adenosyl-L-methionine-dependent methyltransferase [Baffinella frigidus]|nr:S-adenosyl-L-methionine-dependent methyltransferase [Cryptophyta sp. CCMP2293]
MPKKPAATVSSGHGQKSTATASKKPANFAALSICGTDENGTYYASHEELMVTQDANRDEWYAANEEWWVGGYGGSTDSAAMIGDEGGEEDAEEGLRWLDELLRKYPKIQKRRAVDAGAGVGRITRLVLTKRFDSTQLIEADSGWSKRSRVYLGRKRAAKCTFTCSRLEELPDLPPDSADLVWIQWTLQYLTDRDAIKCLRALAAGLSEHGVIVVKENRPYGAQRSDRFFMEVPEGEQGRFDITRPDYHHRLLFRSAGLEVLESVEGEETHTYACRRRTLEEGGGSDPV